MSIRDLAARGRSLVWLVGWFLMLLGTGAWAQDPNRLVDFNIPAQAMSTALVQFGKQAGLQVVSSEEDLRGISAREVKGNFTLRAAIDRLIEGTGLTATFNGGNTLVVKSAVDRGKKTASSDSAAEKTLPNSGDKSEVAKIEPIIVTAQRRPEQLIDVPISIVAIGADELKKREVVSIDDLQFVVPGMAIQSSGAYARRIEIRGISNTFGNGSTIGMYLDEADVTTAFFGSQLDLNAYDLERVEVLRGPQGTLYGEGSAGGTIRFITKNPDLKNFGFESNVAAMFTEHGKPGQRVQAVVNVPVIDDVLGFRIAGTFNREGGWIDQPAADRRDINGQDLTDVRIKGLWKPGPQLTVGALAEIHRNHRSTNTGEDTSGNYTQVFNLTTTPSVADDFDIYNLALTYDFDAVRFLSTTTYLRQEIDTRNFGLLLPLAPPPNPPLNDLLSPFLQTANIFTEELRLTSTGSGPWQWTLGGLYRKVRSDTDLSLAVGPSSSLPSPFQITSNNQSKSWSVFGDSSYKLTDRFTVGAGVRYFRDDEDSTTTPPLAMQSGTFHSTDPRVYAQYELTKGANLYASAAKGFRSGGFNGLSQPPFGPESVWTYELGTKTLLLDGRLRADLAVFYSDYKNYQVVGVTPPPTPANITSNAGDAWIKGIEWNLTWRPAPKWSLSFNGNVLDTRFYKLNVTDSSYIVGDGLDLVPKYALTLSAQRDFDWSGKPGFIRIDYSQQGRETYRNRNIAGPTPWFFSESDVIHMLNLSAGLDLSRDLTLGVFARNLTNDRGYADPYSIQNFASRPAPRTFGIEFAVRFD